MGKIQELRHAVRAELVRYAERHPDDYDAHMAKSASLWLLAGRKGLSQPQQFALIHQAQEVVARLSVGRSSRALGSAQRSLDELVEMLWVPARSQHGDMLFVGRHAEDFARWTLELLEDEAGDEGESS